MTLLALSDVSVEFGDETLFSNVSFTVAPGDRWGLVGRNGTGKTTLLNLIRGNRKPDKGTVALRPGLQVTLLDQHREFGNARTVWEAAAGGYEELQALERAVAAEAARLGELGNRASKDDLERFDRVQERFQHQGGYAYHAKVDAVLQGLGFHADEARQRDLGQLSGGERGRVGLAAQLAAPADLILLDEPTNHLDLDTIQWLRGHLEESGKTVMVISHDRAFLDDFADHILHLADGSATAYRGGYSSFVQQRDRDRLAQERRAEGQRKEIARQEEFIRKNIAGQKTAQAQSRRLRLAKLPRLSPPPTEDATMGVRFEVSNRGGDQVMVVQDLEVGIGDKQLIQGFSAVARRGDVIALVGPNGAGKTTLLATLLGEHPPASGRVRLGEGITPSWYRQDHAHLPAGRTLYDCVGEARPTWNRGQIQEHLGRFGFSGESVRRTTDSLSGGERARVALALITLQGSNLLALDEPTNHLDVESIEALEDALERYPGTVLLVSHDRALLRELATRVWALKDRQVRDFPGPFSDWEERTAEEARLHLRTRLQTDRDARAQEKVRARKEAEARERRQAPVRSARKSVTAAEERVAEAEKVVRELEEALASPDLYVGSPEGAQEAGRLNMALKDARQALDGAMARWAEAVEALDRLESETRVDD